MEWVVVVSITTMEFWAKVNDAMTDEERTAFNEWRDKLWAVGDRIRDESRRATASIAFNSDAGELIRIRLARRHDFPDLSRLGEIEQFAGDIMHQRIVRLPDHRHRDCDR